jgi:hypothetical protein
MVIDFPIDGPGTPLQVMPRDPNQSCLTYR